MLNNTCKKLLNEIIKDMINSICIMTMMNNDQTHVQGQRTIIVAKKQKTNKRAKTEVHWSGLLDYYFCNKDVSTYCN